MLESTVERRFVDLVKKRWPTAICLKLAALGRRGMPDRLVLLPGGVVAFVELKRPGGEATTLQVHVHGLLRALGFKVGVFDDAKEAVLWVASQDHISG